MVQTVSAATNGGCTAGQHTGCRTPNEESPRPTTTGDYSNVVFDFDSTLIQSESLEVMLECVLSQDPLKNDKMRQIAEWTDRGMNGECSFKEGLEARLRIASPTAADIDRFCQLYCPSHFSRGFPELVAELQKQGKQVYILSGGFKDLILPFAQYLSIPDDNVFAVEINWDGDGNFVSLDDTNGFSVSKLDGAERIKHRFANGGTIAVGDGFTDYKLFSSGICTDFIAYTEHAARDKVMAVAPRLAGDSITLWKYLFPGGLQSYCSTSVELVRSAAHGDGGPISAPEQFEDMYVLFRRERRRREKQMAAVQGKTIAAQSVALEYATTSSVPQDSMM